MLNRRGFLGMIGAVVAVSPKPSVDVHVTDPLGTPDAIAAAVDKALMQRMRAIGETFGYLTPDIVIARGYDNGSVRVFFDGLDVRDSPDRFGKVMACDDREGWIDVLARDARGKYFPGRDGNLARARFYGHVRVTMSKKA